MGCLTVDATTAKLVQRHRVRLFGPTRWMQSARVTFPSEQHPTVPIPVSVTRDYGSFRSTYELKGNEMTATREYVINVASLPEERFNDFRAFNSAVEQDSAQQIAVKLTGVDSEAGTSPATGATSIEDQAAARLDAQDFAG